MMETDFHELLHAAEQLSADVESSGELPKVERTLRQVLEASTELWSRVTQTGAQDIQAHLLLGSKGVDLPQLSQKLEVLSARQTFEPLEPTPDSDIQSFLKNERENAILSVIEEVHQTCFAHVEKRQWKSIKNEWNAQKNKIFNALLTSSEAFLNVSLPQPISVGSDSVVGPRSCLNNQEMAYIAQVIEYNQSVVRGVVKSSLVEKFAQAASTFNDKKVNDIWGMVKFMTHLPPMTSSEPLATRNKPEIQNILINQGRKYLEGRYKEYMSSVVNSNLNQAFLGGVPGTYPLVRSFVGVRIPPNTLGLEDGEVDGRPFWPLVYYCLRCGDVTAAMHCARLAGSAMDEFYSLLEEMNNSRVKRLSPRLEAVVRFQYRRSIRNTTDPFKRATYCIIGSCDPNDEHQEIAKAADDYLWLKLCQIREDDSGEQRTADPMSYHCLQTLILEEYGERHYNALEQPHVYFQVLFLTGQFEAGIEFLARVEKLRVHAIHIAIALNEVNLLGLPDHVQAPLLSADPKDSPPARRLNLARLIMLYVRKFELSNTKEALHYYYFLRNLSGPDGKNLFMQCISDLALESRDFDAILGRISEDGCHAPGLVHSFRDVQADAQAITALVAGDCEKKGWFEDAIKLYDLANNHDKVLSLMSILLSQVVHLTSKPGSLRLRLHQTADSVHRRYVGQQFSCSADTASSFFILRDLLAFFDLYHAQENQLALDAIARSKLIPLAQSEVDERAKNFKKLGDEVCKTLPDVLLATMNIIYTQYNKIRGCDNQSTSGGRFEDTTRDKQLLHLREKARAVTSFAGTVPYRMPGDTNSRLVQMEILMH